MRGRAGGRSGAVGRLAYRSPPEPRPRGGCCSRAGRGRPRTGTGRSSSFRTGLPNRGGHVVGKLLEVRAEQLRQLVCLLVVCGVVSPSLAWIEDLIRNAADLLRDFHAEDGITTGGYAIELARQRGANHRPRVRELHALSDAMGPSGPARADEPALHPVTRDSITQHLGVDTRAQRQKRRPEQAENVSFGSVTPRSVPATLAVYPERK